MSEYIIEWSGIGSRIVELPCPFCGGEADVQVEDKCNVLSVGCPSCRIRTPYLIADDVGLSEAIEAWNTRAERTCSVESKIFIEGEYVPCPYYEYEMECGGQFRWDEVEPPNYCPNCGARVVG